MVLVVRDSSSHMEEVLACIPADLKVMLVGFPFWDEVRSRQLLTQSSLLGNWIGGTLFL